MSNDTLGVVRYDYDPNVFWLRNGSWSGKRLDPGNMPELTLAMASNASVLFGADKYKRETSMYVVGLVDGVWYSSLVETSPEAEREVEGFRVNYTRWVPRHQQAVAWDDSIAMVRYVNRWHYPLVVSAAFPRASSWSIDFAINNGSKWEISELAGGDDGNPNPPSIAIAPDGSLWVAIYEPEKPEFRIGRYDGTWDWHVIAQEQGFGGWRDFGVVDGDLALATYSDAGIHVLRLVDDAWQDSIIPGTEGASGGLIAEIGQESFIIYTVPTGEENEDGWPREESRAAVLRDGNWTEYSLDTATLATTVDVLYWTGTLYYLFASSADGGNFLVTCPVQFEAVAAAEEEAPGAPAAASLAAALLGAWIHTPRRRAAGPQAAEHDAPASP